MHVWQLLTRTSIAMLFACTLASANAEPQQVLNLPGRRVDADIRLSGYMFKVDMKADVKSFIVVINERIHDSDEERVVTSYCHADEADLVKRLYGDYDYDYSVGRKTKVPLHGGHSLFFFSFHPLSNLKPFLGKMLHNRYQYEILPRRHVSPIPAGI